MSGTNLVPSASANSGLSADTRTKLSQLGPLWVQASCKLAESAPVIDDAWVDGVASSGGVFTVSAITQAFAAVSQPDDQWQKDKRALQAFADGALRRIQRLAAEAPSEAQVMVEAWKQNLITQTLALAKQAASVNQSIGVMQGVLGGDADTAERKQYAAELQSVVDELTNLHDRLDTATDDAALRDVVAGAAAASEAEQTATVMTSIVTAIEQATAEVVAVGTSAVQELTRVGEAAVRKLDGNGARRSSRRTAKKAAKKAGRRRR